MAKRQSKSQPTGRKTDPVTCDTVRRLALALPDVEETASKGAPTFRVRGKLIAQMDQDGESLLIKVDYFKRDILMHAEPETFFITDFYRCHPMMFVRLSTVRLQTLRELLEQAWRLQAPKRLAQAYDSKSQ